ncbi:unnamed protein product (macronuclear) [Paramecium tetraurelia]|uniref:Uncharacterized protein n=1 Tax=Paramecium tetraurelia TaxID=5888 RepID=A0CK98_PARTE|nr:uncharacterized protein GSPATT00000928001 [Paramecium tetraurelia]CAK71215.1 unnamed protein product [Paramecium tetraurelia]|eukprot:XP_001438612.1 hypothetical protein (macronuclear) [Paramecium tetraurelia strain d4-2]
MDNQQLIEEPQIINYEYQNPERSQEGFRSLKPLNEQDEIQQINKSQLKNLNSSSIQGFSKQQSGIGQENQDDDLNFIQKEKQGKNSIETLQGEQQQIPLQQFNQKEENLIENESKVPEVQIHQKKIQKTDDKELKNYSQFNNNSKTKDVKQVTINLSIEQNSKHNSDLKNEQQQNIKKNFQKQIQQYKRDEKQCNQMIESNLNQIFLFYTNQFQTHNKQTKDQILQKQVLNLQQFMNFCKDFQILDLQVTNEFIQQYAGHKVQKPLYKIKYKNRVGGTYVISKYILEEIFQKCSNIHQLSFQEFLYSLIKIADITFPVSNSLQAFYLYLGFHDPEIYSKKLINPQDMNQTRMQVQTTPNIKQELKITRSVEKQTKSQNHRIDYLQPISKLNQIQLLQKNTKIYSNRNQGQIVKYDYRDDICDFDPRKLLLEGDLIDQEDEFYLRDYQINNQGGVKKQELINQYQERIKYYQYPYQNQQSKSKQGQTEQIYIQQNQQDLQQNLRLQQNTMSIKTILEKQDAYLVNSKINQTTKQLQKQKFQQIHPNSFELRNNYNIVKQLPALNLSYAYPNISSSIERDQLNTSQNHQQIKENTKRLETTNEKRELKGILKNQYYSIRKIFRK